MKYGNSPKMCPKPMKPALKFCFYPKTKYENNHLIDMVGMIEPLSNTSNCRKCFKYHEIIIFEIIWELF